MTTKDDIIKYALHTPENTNPSVLGGLLSDLQEGKSIQSDWNQNDETAVDYVKNRPFYKGKGRKTLASYYALNVSTQYNDTYYVVDLRSSLSDINDGDNITVEISYNYGQYTAYTNVPITTYYVGGGTYSFDYLGDQDGYPFKITSNKAYFTQPGTYHLNIYKEDVDVIFTIPVEYLPMEALSDSLTNHTHSSLYYNGSLRVSLYDTVLSPVGSMDFGSQDKPWNNIYVGSSISLSRKANTTIGTNSTAVGYDTEASGANSHAEGSGTTASGVHSHAEGYDTTASGRSSHAEGANNEASGANSHTEGEYTTASGQSSHAEGYGTKASSNNQHVRGRYNIEDSSNTYADIIGNGTNKKRSNAATVDWSGNAWYAGTIEGTALILPSSTANSTKKFKITVDDSGTLSATEITA